MDYIIQTHKYDNKPCSTTFLTYYIGSLFTGSFERHHDSVQIIFQWNYTETTQNSNSKYENNSGIVS